MLISTSKTVALCSFSNLINAADRAIMPIAILQMAPEFNWDMHAQGWILSAFPIGYFSSQIIGGQFSRRFGGKPVLALAVLIWSLLTFLTPLFASSLRILIVSRIALGIAEGVGLPAVVQIFSTCIMADERSRAFGYLVAFGSFGQTVAAIICPHLNWRWMFLMFGCMGFTWVVTWLLVFKEIRITSIEDDFMLLPPKVMQQDDVEPTHRTNWIDYFKYPQLWSIYIAHFAMSWNSYIITVWLPYYLSKNLGVSAQALSFTAVPFVVNSFAGIVSGHFADSLVNRGWSLLSIRRTMTTIGLVGPALFMLIFIYVDSLATAIIIISISMGLMACNSCGHLANHLDIAPNCGAITFGISNTISTIAGIACGPLTAEIVVKSGGQWFPVFIISTSLQLIGALVYYTHSSASQIF